MTTNANRNKRANQTRRNQSPTGRVLMASKDDETYIRRTKLANGLPFSMPKTSQLDDPVLIFTHEGLIGRGKIAEKPDKDPKHPNFLGRPVLWGKLDNVELLSDHLPNEEVHRRMSAKSQIIKEWV